ncbi:MAG TPA: ABC transporter ATP-binding protein [Ruminiclostridium sp.]|nr:ABC transporter ATP-binding protein [Ruminiclostridium sp.]
MKSTIAKRIEVLKVLRPFVKNMKSQLFLLGLLKICLLVLGLIAPYLYKLLVDEVMTKGRFGLLKWICAGYIAIFIVSSVLLFIQRIKGNKFFFKLLFDIRYRIWNNYLKMYVYKYSNCNIGDLKNRVDDDTNAFEKFLGQHVIDYTYNWVYAVLNGAVILFLNWKLALFGFIMVPFPFLMSKWIGKRVQNANDKQKVLWVKYEKWIYACIQGWKEIKTFTAEKVSSMSFTRHWKHIGRNFFVVQMLFNISRTFWVIKDVFITKVSLYFIGGVLIMNGEITIGSLLVFMKYYQGLFDGVSEVNRLDIDLHNDIPSMDRVLEVLVQKEEVKRGTLRPDRFVPGIEFKNVTFAYEGTTKDVLKKLSLEIKPNERIAIVGRSGSGKTTLAKLILGLCHAGEGKVLISGNDIKELDPAFLHRHVGAVMQDNYLFNLTIRENLLMAKPNAEEAEIRKACKLAYIDEFIEGLPEGYETLIGEKGIKLSGGQKQRLAIARTFLANPAIIIFDEATSALDHESEKVIHKAIENISRNRTVIIIAHRLSSILSANRILVLDDGEIVEEGHHTELHGKNGVYDILFKQQYEMQKLTAL